MDRRVEKIEVMLADTFEEHYNTGMLTVSYPFLAHMMENLQ